MLITFELVSNMLTNLTLFNCRSVDKMSQASGSAGTADTKKTAATAKKVTHPTYEKMIQQSLTDLAVS